MISLLDYGMGNLRSVQRAFEAVADGARVITTAEEIDAADRLVVPGVGAFADAARHLRESGVGEAIRRHVASGKPFLGICLGMQLLVDVGTEDGEHAGLGVVPGRCVRLDVDRTAGLKVPHMGWNGLAFDAACPLFVGLDQGDHAYFVHVYHVEPADETDVAAVADYGGPFAAALWRDNLYATQFHPEKSQRVGLTMLRNFARL